MLGLFSSNIICFSALSKRKKNPRGDNRGFGNTGKRASASKKGGAVWQEQWEEAPEQG